jgi:hypothetical protein
MVFLSSRLASPFRVMYWHRSPSIRVMPTYCRKISARRSRWSSKSCNPGRGPVQSSGWMMRGLPWADAVTDARKRQRKSVRGIFRPNLQLSRATMTHHIRLRRPTLVVLFPGGLCMPICCANPGLRSQHALSCTIEPPDTTNRLHRYSRIEGHLSRYL